MVGGLGVGLVGLLAVLFGLLFGWFVVFRFLWLETVAVALLFGFVLFDSVGIFVF